MVGSVHGACVRGSAATTELEATCSGKFLGTTGCERNSCAVARRRRGGDELGCRRLDIESTQRQAQGP